MEPSRATWVPGGPELWVAGVSKATLRRAAKTGVWHPVALSVEELRELGRGFEGRIVLRIRSEEHRTLWAEPLVPLRPF